MSIENFESNESIYKIEEEPVEKLFDAMKQMAKKHNEYFRKKTKRKQDKNGNEIEMIPVLDDACQVNPHCFQELFKPGFLDNIPEIVKEFEYRKSYAELYPKEHRNEVHRLWKEKKEKGIPNQWEMALTALLDKALGDEFMVIRSSSYDDYSHGLDTLIIHKTTNTVVCTLDEVSDYNGADDKRNDDPFSNKRNKVFHIMKEQRGVKAEYVPIVSGGGLMVRELKNAPLFYLGIRKNELDKLLRHIDPNTERLNLQELSVFEKVITSIKEQMEEYKKFMDIKKEGHFDERLIKNLKKMDEIIPIMEKIDKDILPQNENSETIKRAS